MTLRELQQTVIPLRHKIPKRLEELAKQDLEMIQNQLVS
jgi:hypothetical protein